MRTRPNRLVAARCLERRCSGKCAGRPARLSLATKIDQAGELVEVNCGECHAVGEADASPHEAAPPFRKLSEMFPMDALEEAFSDGRIYSGHPDMPEFIATPEQVDAIIAYIASLQD
jgi:cytochrome c